MTVADLTRPLLAVDADAADLLFRGARTASRFSDEPVSEEQLRAIYELVKWAPTSMNSQPLRVALVQSPQARTRLVSHMAAGNQAKTAAAPVVAVLSADRQFHEQLPTQFPHAPGVKDIFAPIAARLSRGSTPRCRWATSSSAFARSAWPLGR